MNTDRELDHDVSNTVRKFCGPCKNFGSDGNCAVFKRIRDHFSTVRNGLCEEAIVGGSHVVMTPERYLKYNIWIDKNKPLKPQFIIRNDIP
jgi:hypothetical protein